ncbi:hypothetical protein [Sphingomonas colocasiae]|uniref:Uncharacterized protein n=1 Tax=Sphingomonas colocasiae TaxID=1848973 RepID=A0ABS7PV73_9SPHN|nr:hypothetical protein [Sphingomonas colocasiae]MBY8825171.1 hypothetical protein [Sphingomonas colocasiae]
MPDLIVTIVISLVAVPVAVGICWARHLIPGPALGIFILAMGTAPLMAMLPETDAETYTILFSVPAWWGIIGWGWMAGAPRQGDRKNRWTLPSLLIAVAAFDAICLSAIFIATQLERHDRMRVAREYEQRENRRIATEARRCAVELAARDPVADARTDVARGDATPIGLTAIPHDGLDSSFYPEACDNAPEGHRYQNTGKWFRRNFTSFAIGLGTPHNAPECARAIRDYAVRYNQAMIWLAPRQVRHFCSNLKVLPLRRL